MNGRSFAEMYEQELVQPLFQPWAEILLERVGVKPGDRVLDVACGTGIVARLAKARLGPEAIVVGVDASSPMLAVAGQVAPDIEWREGKAEALPLRESEQFTVAVCQQGLQFFSDRLQALSEMRRALVAGGRLALAIWRPLEENPFFAETQAVAERYLGPILDRRHCFGDSQQIVRLVEMAGFSRTLVEIVSCSSHFNDASTFVKMNTLALVGMSDSAKAMTEEQRGAIVARIIPETARVTAGYIRDQALTFALRSNIITAIA